MTNMRILFASFVHSYIHLKCSTERWDFLWFIAWIFLWKFITGEKLYLHIKFTCKHKYKQTNKQTNKRANKRLTTTTNQWRYDGSQIFQKSLFFILFCSRWFCSLFLILQLVTDFNKYPFIFCVWWILNKKTTRNNSKNVEMFISDMEKVIAM